MCVCASVCVSVCYHSSANIAHFYAQSEVYSGTSLFQPHSGPAKVAGLVGWLDLRETSLIQPYYDMAELAGLASFTQAHA